VSNIIEEALKKVTFDSNQTEKRSAPRIGKMERIANHTHSRIEASESLILID